MGFVNKQPKITSKIIKSDITLDEFKNSHFEPIGNNDYWVFKSMSMQKTHLKIDPNGSKLSPKVILYQSQSSKSLTKLFGAPNFPQYNDYIYDIWVMEYQHMTYLIRQSFEGTTYDVLLEKGSDIHSDSDLGLKIEDFMKGILKFYTK